MYHFFPGRAQFVQSVTFLRGDLSTSLSAKVTGTGFSRGKSPLKIVDRGTPGRPRREVEHKPLPTRPAGRGLCSTFRRVAPRCAR